MSMDALDPVKNIVYSDIQCTDVESHTYYVAFDPEELL